MMIAYVLIILIAFSAGFGACAIWTHSTAQDAYQQGYVDGYFGKPKRKEKK